jgi:hypothetical protein
MSNFYRHYLSRGNARFSWLVAAAITFAGTSSSTAQETLVYSFEPDLQGFVGNGPITPTLETSGLGATDGSNSMKVVHAMFNGFAGVITQNIPAGFPNDPSDPGIDFLRFDLTLTSRFAPPATDPPTPGVPTFASLGLTLFGSLPGNPVPEAQIQYLLDEKEVGSLEAGTYTLEIDLRNGGGDGMIGAGLNVDTGVTNGYDGWIDAGFVPLEFQIYSNKSVSGTNPAFEWTFYVDNIRVGRDVSIVSGDHNGDGSVDAADYAAWRKDPNGFGGDPAGYNVWRQSFGAGGAGGGGTAAVPEPSALFLLFVATLWGCGTWNGRSVVR